MQCVYGVRDQVMEQARGLFHDIHILIEELDPPSRLLQRGIPGVIREPRLQMLQLDYLFFFSFPYNMWMFLFLGHDDNIYINVFLT